MISISCPVLFSMNGTVGEMADKGSIHLRINRKSHVEPILLYFVDVPQSIGGRPPDTQPSQARKRVVRYGNVARPAVVHVAKHHLKPHSCIVEKLAEDGPLFDFLILGALLRFFIPPDKFPSLLFREFCNPPFLRRDARWVLQLHAIANIAYSNRSWPWLSNHLIDPIWVFFLPRHPYSSYHLVSSHPLLSANSATRRLCKSRLIESSFAERAHTYPTARLPGPGSINTCNG